MLTAQDLTEITPYISGRQVPSGSNDQYAIYNPFSGTKLLDIPRGCVRDAENAVAAARLAFESGAWCRAAPSARKQVLHRWADLIAAHATRLDALDALEMGKPVSVAFANAKAASGLARFNAEALDKLASDVLSSEHTSTVFQKRVPRGVVAAIVPWNFPTYNVVLKVAPALAAGNTVVLKPSELASQSAFTLVALAHEAGLPPGTLNMIPGTGDAVGRALAQHTDVNMVTFTGSTAVGKLMIQYAGNSNMKVVNAECGGKSPHIVFDDGLDLDQVAASVAGMISSNQGQVCSVGSRVLVQDTIEEPFVERVLAQLERIVAGDPQTPTITYGPLVSKRQMEKVLSYIASGSEDGADLVYGGSRMLVETGGYFVEPAVFVNVPESSRIAQEEIFGPVLSILRFHDAEDAIRLANSTCYGLAAYVWTSKLETGFKMANSLCTAYTMVNSGIADGEGPGHAFSCEPAALSGIGAEGGVAGLQSYTRRQTCWFNHR